MFSGVSPIDHMRLMRDVEELKTSFGNALRVGPVHKVDAKRGYRLKLGEDADGEPWLTPWIPHPETGKTSVPLKVGQIVGLASPNGDMRQGMLLRDGYGGDHKSPNEDMEANVFADAGIRLHLADGVLTVEASGKVVVNAPEVELGGEGGKKVARVGDLVNVGSGSSRGLWPIVTGSESVSATD